MDLPKQIEVQVATNSKYGRFHVGDTLTVGTDIDETGAQRWLENGIAKRGDLKKKRSGKPTSSNTVKQIKKWLDDNEVDYTSTLTKDELLELVNNAES